MDESQAHPRFVGHALESPCWRQFVVANSTGSAQPQFNAAVMRSFELAVPPLPEQERIASVLDALDDKIAGNRRLVRLLGEASGTLFTHLDAAATDTMAIGEVVDVIDCLHSKKPVQQAQGRQLLQLNNIREDGLLDVEPRFLVSEADYANWTRRIELRAGDCVITNVGRVGAVARIPEIKAALGRNMTGVRCRVEWPFAAVLIEVLMSSRTQRAIDELTDAGTVMNALNVRNIPRLPLPVISRDSLEEVEADLSTMWRLREALLREAGAQRRVRDALLPSLIAGQIRVPDTHDPEEVVGPVAEQFAAGKS
jgi:type I restriction enzyme S subunit